MSRDPRIFDRLQNCWDPLSEAHVDQLELDQRVTLPDDYRRFLLQFNAGNWVRGVGCRLHDCEPRWDELHIDINLGIVPDSRFWIYDIIGNRRAYSHFVPDYILPIMQAQAGIVGIEFSRPSPQRIVALDFQADEHGDTLIYHVADNFTAFLDMLQPDEELDDFREELPAFQAAERGQTDAVRQYLADGGKVDLRNDRGWTLAMCAAHGSWPKVLAVLLEAGADANARDAAGLTPLHHAIHSHSFDSTKLLVAAGAELGYRDHEGRNLAEIARAERAYRLCHYFEPLVG